MKQNQLDENQIYIIQAALDFAKDKLKTVYQEGYVNEQLISIKEVLEQQLRDQEHHR